MLADHGLVTDNNEGTYTFTPDKDYNGPVQFSYQVQDEHGASVAQSASMTLTPVNDAAVITDETLQRHAITEDQRVQPSGIIETDENQLRIVDPDAGESLFVPTGRAHGTGATGTWVVGDKGVGQFILHADGRWFYKVDNANPTIDGLKTGENFTETLTIHSADGTAHVLTATVHGSDDQASITGTSSGAVTEDTALAAGKLTTGGDLIISDPDAGEAAFMAQSTISGSGGFGTFSVDATGHWTYSADNSQASIQELKDGETATDTATITSVDGTTHTLTVMLTGTNDAPVISGQVTASGTEDTHLQGHRILVQGTLNITDVDSGEDHFVDDMSIPGSLGLGSFGILASGRWVYAADNNDSRIQQLGDGETLTETATIRSVDGTMQTLTVTIHGTNDAPTVSSSVALTTGMEDTVVTLQASDLLANASDVDQGAQLSIHNLSADHGQIIDNHDGTFSFTPAKDYNGLVQFNYQVQDEHGAAVAQSASMTLT